MWSSPLCAPPLVVGHCALSPQRDTTCQFWACVIYCFSALYLCLCALSFLPPHHQCNGWPPPHANFEFALVIYYSSAVMKEEQGSARGLCEILAKTNDLICCPLSRHVFSWKIWDINIFVLAIHTDVNTLVVSCWCFFFVFSSKVYQVNTAFENSLDFVFTTLQSKFTIFTNSVKSFSSKCLLGRIFETIFKFPV